VEARIASITAVKVRWAATRSSSGMSANGRHDVAANDFRALLHIMVAETSGAPLTAGDLRQRMGVSGPARQRR
jgi:hypothetical protein